MVITEYYVWRQRCIFCDKLGVFVVFPWFVIHPEQMCSLPKLKSIEYYSPAQHYWHSLSFYVINVSKK